MKPNRRQTSGTPPTTDLAVLEQSPLPSTPVIPGAQDDANHILMLPDCGYTRTREKDETTFAFHSSESCVGYSVTISNLCLREVDFIQGGKNIIQPRHSAFPMAILSPEITLLRIPFFALSGRNNVEHVIESIPWPFHTPPRMLRHLGTSGFRGHIQWGILALAPDSKGIWIVSKFSQCEVAVKWDQSLVLLAEFPFLRNFLTQIAKNMQQHNAAVIASNMASKDVSEMPHPLDVDPPSPTSRFSLRRDLKAWRLVFDGQEAVLKHERGILYVAYLLQHPPSRPIHAHDLFTKIRDLYQQQIGITKVTCPVTGRSVQLGKDAQIQQRNLGLETMAVTKAMWEKKREWEAVLEDDTVSAPEKNEAMSMLDQIAEFQKMNVAENKSAAENLVRAVRRAITRFHDNLAKAVDNDGSPHPVLRPFADHLNKYLLIPSGRLSGNRYKRLQAGFAGRFTYEPPNGLTWTN